MRRCAGFENAHILRVCCAFRNPRALPDDLILVFQQPVNPMARRVADSAIIMEYSLGLSILDCLVMGRIGLSMRSIRSRIDRATFNLLRKERTWLN
jgi:hypothetical protein